MALPWLRRPQLARQGPGAGDRARQCLGLSSRAGPAGATVLRGSDSLGSLAGQQAPGPGSESDS